MKKFLIALLSLAMLFSFAACDNNTKVDEDPDTPSVDEPTSSFSDQNIADALNYVFVPTGGSGTTATTGFNGGLIASIKDLLGNGNDILADDSWSADHDKYTVTIDPTTYALTVTKQVAKASEQGTYPAESVTLKVNGIQKAKTNPTDDVVVYYNDFTYDYATYKMISNNIVKIEGSVAGYLGGSAYATIETGADNTTPATYKATVTSLAVTLNSDPAKSTLSLNGSSVPTGKVFDIIGKDATAEPMTYASYKDKLDSSMKKAIETYVTELFSNETDAAADLFVKLDGFESSLGTNKAADLKVENTNTSVSVTLTPSAEAVELAKKDAVVVSLAKGSTLSMTIAGTGNENAFSPSTATISGTFNVTGDATNDANGKIKTIKLEGFTIKVSGTFDVSLDGITFVSAEGNKATFSADTAKDWDGDVVTTIKYGPAIEASTTAANGYEFVEGDVTKSY